MNSSSSPPCGQPAVFLQPEWQRQVGAWRDLLTQCARKPSRKRVHNLRSLTLRLRVALEYRLLEQAQDPTAAGAFRRWNKEGQKLRRALEPVRDVDVYLARLDGLRDTLGEASDGEPKRSPRCLREMDKLESRLKQRRKEGIHRLMAVIDVRGNRLSRLSKEMEAALVPRMSSKALSTGQAALRIFAGLASEFPHLDSANLHAYRKRLKPALYLAEISATADPLAGRLAAAFRKIHLAAGEWHDWQALAQKASRVFPGHARQDGLVPVLEKLADGALQRALGLCRRSAARFLKSIGAVRPSPRQKPVASDAGCHRCDEYPSLGISSYRAASVPGRSIVSTRG
jgi:CHAD domain-containing protein